MTIDEAINHCMDVAETQEMCTNGLVCAKEHRQLAEWLRQLQNYQTAREEINQEIINWNDIDNGKVRGLFLAESIIAHYVERGAK